MSSWSCDQKVCTSCRFWCGKRKIDFMANFFEAEDNRGECAGPRGSFRGVKTGEGSSCSEWETFRNSR